MSQDARPVVVLGAAGQLGRALLRAAASEAVVPFTRDAVDITSLPALQEVLNRVKPRAVINASAYTAVDRAEDEPELAYAVNGEGPGNLARLAAASGVRVLHVSTDFVFDGREGRPYAPDAATHPLGVYGASKLAGEQAVLASGADAIVVRTGWVYSADGANFVKTMLRLMGERDTLNVVEDQIGTPTWASGLAAVCWQLLDDPTAHGVYHWSDSGACSWYDFALAIRDEATACGLLSDPAAIHPIPAAEYPTPATRPSFSVLDKARTRSQLGTHGQHWREALRAMLATMPPTE